MDYTKMDSNSNLKYFIYYLKFVDSYNSHYSLNVTQINKEFMLIF